MQVGLGGINDILWGHYKSMLASMTISSTERKNRTLVGVAKAMLFDQVLPLFLWVEAYRTTVYIQNKCPHTILGRKTPKEVFTGTRTDVSHLRIWECLLLSHSC